MHTRYQNYKQFNTLSASEESNRSVLFVEKQLKNFGSGLKAGNYGYCCCSTINTKLYVYYEATKSSDEAPGRGRREESPTARGIGAETSILFPWRND